jgi:hypothetical protein
MKLFDEHVDYGLGMWRYAVWISAGAIFAMAGPVAANLVVNSILGLIPIPASAQQVVLLAGIVLTQIGGAILAGAGFFGGLHRVLEDTQ